MASTSNAPSYRAPRTLSTLAPALEHTCPPIDGYTAHPGMSLVKVVYRSAEPGMFLADDEKTCLEKCKDGDPDNCSSFVFEQPRDYAATCRYPQSSDPLALVPGPYDDDDQYQYCAYTKNGSHHYIRL